MGFLNPEKFSDAEKGEATITQGHALNVDTCQKP